MASKTRQSYQTRGARIAASAATWCAVHCALTPVLAVAAPALALSESVEQWMLAATVTLATLLIAVGPATGRGRITGLLALGTGIWTASLMGWTEPLPEPVTSAAGSLLVAGAMVLSSRVCTGGDCEICGD